MITKTCKLEIISAENIDKKILNEVLRELQYNTWKMKNRAIQILWDYQNFKFTYEKFHGEYYSKLHGNNTPNGNGIQKDIIQETKEWNEMMPGSMKPAIERSVNLKWKNDLKTILSGERSIPSYSQNGPIELHNNLMFDSKRNPQITRENNGRYSTYYIRINLLARNYAKEKYQLKDGGFKLKLANGDSSTMTILDRLMSGEYLLGGSKISYHKTKKKWFLLLNYKFEKTEKVLDKNNILGIDLGITIPIMTAFNQNEKHRKSIGSSEEVRAFENQMYKRKSLLQKSRVSAGEGSRGHGRKTLSKPLNKLRTKISDFKKTKNHTWSKQVIDEALANDCGVIQMEDLSGISQNNEVFLKRWTYYDLQQKIRYKAEEVGIEVRLIKPRYTSARCSRCGFIHEYGNFKKIEWRPTQSQFHCQNCDFQTNADANAARNISMLDIENIINEQEKNQRKIREKQI